MAARKVTLYMKNGNSHSLICKNEQIYHQLLSEIDNGERIEISVKNKIISLRGSQVDYHEWEYL